MFPPTSKASFHYFSTHFHQLSKLFHLSQDPFHHFVKITYISLHFHSHLTSYFRFLLLGLCVIMEAESLPERKRQHKGGRILRYEPSDCNTINSYPFIKQCFEDVHYLEFCKRVSKTRFHEKLTDWVATHLKGETVFISGIEFNFSVASISIATGLPDNGEYWFKGMNLDLENYKPFLKTPYRDTHTHLLPFRYLLEKYALLIKTVMRFFTCEGRFSRLYAYHIRLLMHFTSQKPLNICNYLFKSISKMSEKLQLKDKEHSPSLFHHSLIKTIVLHQLLQQILASRTVAQLSVPSCTSATLLCLSHCCILLGSRCLETPAL